MRAAAIMKRIIRQFRRDKRALALMFLAPLLVLTLLWLVMDSDEYVPNIAVVDLPSPLIELLQKQELNIEELSESEAIDAIHAREIDAYMMWENHHVELIIEGGDLTASGAVLRNLQQIQGLTPQTDLELEVTYLHGSEELVLFDHIGPVLIGFFVFFFVFIIGGVSFLRERTQGTLERLLATPIRRWEIVIGYLCGFGLFTILQSVIIVIYSVYVLDIYMAGSIFYVLLITLLLAISALSLGTLLSAFAKNEFQMIQFIPIVIVPQVFFSGLFPLDTMEPWLRAIGQIMPLTYGAEALREVMIRGQGFTGMYTYVYILLGFSVLFLILNVLAMKKHRSI